MKKEITKIKQELEKYNINITPGDYYIDGRGDYYRVKKIDDEGIHLEDRWGDDEWKHYATKSVEAFNNSYFKIDGIKKENENKILDELKNINDLKLLKEQKSEFTQLTIFKNDNALQIVKDNLEEKHRKIKTYEAYLERISSELLSLKYDYEDKLNKIYKIIGSIETYLGINEKIIQIQEGEQAKISTPLSIRQLVLYMDEEVGIVENQGMDWKNIEDFDKWLLNKENLNRLIPEKKCILAFKPRRYEKDQGVINIFTCDLEKQFNKKSYILIRNGGNVYRIWAKHNVGNLLFPKKTEINNILDGLENEEIHRWKKEELEDVLFKYKKNLLIFQGLIDRTDILKPHISGLSLIKYEENKKHINLIYDAENLLPTGRKTWKEFKEDINEKIKRGSRVIFKGFSYRDTNKDGGNYHFNHYVNNKPLSGIYNVLAVNNNEDKPYYSRKAPLKMNYNPKDTIFGHYNNHERHKAITFYADYNHVINYDLLTLEDIEYYLNNRVDRKNYLDMLLLLKEYKKKRLDELKWEKEFIKFLGNELKQDHSKSEIEIEIENIIWKVIEWWKNKVIWKRPIMKDDAKALRMIKSRVKKILNGEIKI